MRNYDNHIKVAAESSFIPWDKLKNKTILLSGATGMIGSTFIDLIDERNKKFNDDIKIIALGRDRNKAERRLKLTERHFVNFIEQDVSNPFSIQNSIDYVIHAASNTHPIQYATQPIETISTNVFGLNRMLEISKEKKATLTFLSSVEIYGKNRGDTDEFNEEYCGYIDCNTLRAGYTESKRLGEAMCQAYKAQYDVDIRIARLSRVYGVTMQEDDSKVMAQFLRNAVNAEDIVLKSAGTQEFGYVNVIDAVTGILTVMLKGKSGEAYNIEAENSRVNLKDLANNIANISGTKVVFSLPSIDEKIGYSCADKAIMNTDKIKNLGWIAEIDIKSGIRSVIEDLSQELT